MTIVTTEVGRNQDNNMAIIKSIVAVEMVEAVKENGIIMAGDTMPTEIEHMTRIGGRRAMTIHQGIEFLCGLKSHHLSCLFF